MTNSLKDIFIKQIEHTLKTAKKPDPWLDESAVYSKLKLLSSADERGRNGQEFFQTVFKMAGYRTIGDNEKTGDWDIKINNWRIEVKTGKMDRAYKFQHENIHKVDNCYDFVFFLDVAPNEMYFSCCAYSDIPWKHLHFRAKPNRPTGAGWKWDINYKSINSPKLPKHHGLVETVDDIIKIFKDCLEEHPILNY